MPAANTPGSDGVADGLRRGDPGAFEALLRDHGAAFLSTATHLVGAEHAPAVVRRAFTIAMQSRGQLPDDLAPHLWLRRLTVGVALEELKSMDRPAEEAIEDLVPRFLPTGAHVETFPPWPESAAPDAGREPTASAVRAAVGRMPAPFRAVLVLHDFDGLSSDEVSAVLGVPVNAVRIRLHRARLALRTLIAPVLIAGGQA